jgi:toxin ParE1/3/4
MARLVWTEPALADLDAIADYIALDKPIAARLFVQTVFKKVSALEKFSNLGNVPPEIKGLPYRQLVIPPCRLFYRTDGKKVFIVAVIRGERQLKKDILDR